MKNKYKVISFCLFSSALIFSASAQTLDTNFNANLGSGFDSFILAVAIHKDVTNNGKILVGGNFSNLNGVNVPDKLMRFNTNGIPDNAFNANLGSGFNGIVKCVLVQDDGKVLVGGTFTAFNGNDIPDSIFRLNADGTPDMNFNNNFGLNGLGGGGGGGVTCLAKHGDGILVGGDFMTFDGDPSGPNRLMRIDANGVLDGNFLPNMGFNPGFDNQVNAVAVQSDGKILVGGFFSTYDVSDVPDRFVRLNSNGTFDTTFTNSLGTGFDFSVNAISVGNTGKIFVGGIFENLNGTDVPNKFLSFNSNGTLNTAFNTNLGSGFNAGLSAVLTIGIIPSNEKLMLGGGLFDLNGTNVPNGLVRLNSDGTLDPAFTTNSYGVGISDPLASPAVYSLAIQTDEKVLVGGDFTTNNGANISDHLFRFTVVSTGGGGGGGSTNGGSTNLLTGVKFDKLVPKNGKNLSFKVTKGFKAKGRVITTSGTASTNTFVADVYAFFKTGEGTNAIQTSPIKLTQKPKIPKKLAKKGVLIIFKADKASGRVGVSALPVEKGKSVSVVFFVSNNNGIYAETNNLTAKNIK